MIIISDKDFGNIEINGFNIPKGAEGYNACETEAMRLAYSNNIEKPAFSLIDDFSGQKKLVVAEAGTEVVRENVFRSIEGFKYIQKFRNKIFLYKIHPTTWSFFCKDGGKTAEESLEERREEYLEEKRKDNYGGYVDRGTMLYNMALAGIPLDDEIDKLFKDVGLDEKKYGEKESRERTLDKKRMCDALTGFAIGKDTENEYGEKESAEKYGYHHFFADITVLGFIVIFIVWLLYGGGN